MFMTFVYFVSMCLLVIKTEDNLVKIEIKVLDQGACSVPHEIRLVEDKKYSLEVESDYFIIGTNWTHKSTKKYLEKFSINSERTIQSGVNVTNKKNTFIYKYSQIHKVKKHFDGDWEFIFKLLIHYDPWSWKYQFRNVYYNSTCSSSVKIVERPLSRNSTGTIDTSTTSDSQKYWATVILPIIGVFFIIQSVYLIIGKIRRRASNRRKNDEETRTNIADRPPLPLPPAEVTKEEPTPPVSPGPNRHHHFAATAPFIPVQNIYNNIPINHGPMAPKHAYRNKGLNTSEEQVKSPGFSRREFEDSLTTNQLYRHTAVDNSDDEHMSPGFARRQIQANLGPFVPPKDACASKSFKNPKALPREPSRPLEMVSPIHSALRHDNRTSDVDWQYETLQPACRYLNR